MLRGSELLRRLRSVAALRGLIEDYSRTAALLGLPPEPNDRAIPASILLADPDPRSRDRLTLILSGEFRVDSISDPDLALRQAGAVSYDVAIVSSDWPSLDGRFSRDSTGSGPPPLHLCHRTRGRAGRSRKSCGRCDHAAGRPVRSDTSGSRDGQKEPALRLVPRGRRGAVRLGGGQGGFHRFPPSSRPFRRLNSSLMPKPCRWKRFGLTLMMD